MKLQFVVQKKSSQSQNSHILAVRYEKNLGFVSCVCRGEAQ